MEQADDGSIKLLSYREAHEITKKVRSAEAAEITEEVNSAFIIDTFNSSELSLEATLLNADPLTYEAEKLFGLDLNDDGVQGRNVQKLQISTGRVLWLGNLGEDIYDY